MSLFIPLKRATLLLPSGTDSEKDKKHLFILLTNPYDNGVGEKPTLLVSVSTVKENFHHDPTCFLYKGDHPFIKSKSYVVYKKTRIECANKLSRGIKKNVFVAHEAMDQLIFCRICKGLEDSRFTIPAHLAFYKKVTGNINNGP